MSTIFIDNYGSINSSMRAYQFIIKESRGVTARTSGETYVSDTNSDDVLTIQNIDVLPDNAAGYENYEELEAALDIAIPDKNKRINDNNPNSAMTAAIVATVTDKNNQPQYWVRYIKAIPPQGIHSMWKTLRGYKFGKGVEQETTPIKPSDLVPDENFRSASQLAQQIKTGTKDLGDLGEVIGQAVDQAMRGTAQPIPAGDKYYNVLQKYGGEYLGPIALMNAPASVTGDTAKMMQQFGLKNFAGSRVMFPQDTQQELIDSVIQTADGRSIQVSSKISTSGGAASSLSGIYKQMTPEIKQRFPQGAEIIETFATKSAIVGPLEVARMVGVLDNADIQAMVNLNKSSRNIADLKTPRLQQLVKQQGVAPDTLKRDDYRVFWHALNAIVNAVVPVVNGMDEFKNAMLEVLNNNEYVQLVTQAKAQGDAVSLKYYTKFPAVFKGAPQLYNKTYFATGQKGRIGFKLMG